MSYNCGSLKNQRSLTLCMFVICHIVPPPSSPILTLFDWDYVDSKRAVGGGIVGKKWDPGILDPGRFSAQIRKVEARLGKLAKIRKVETN